MFDSKRGEALDLLMHPAFVIFIAVFLLVYLLWFIHGIGSDASYEKKFLATDLALTVDSLLASRDNVVLYYLPQAKEYAPKFSYDFSKNIVTVFESSKNENDAGVYYFTSDPSVSFAPVSLKPSLPFILPKFSKVGRTLFVSDGNRKGSGANVYALPCSEKRYDYGSITFDPAHGFDAELGEGDTGFVAGGLKEFELTREIGSIVKVLDTSGHIEAFTRDSDIVLPVSSRKNSIGNSLISLHIGSVKSGDTFVKAYVNYDSKKMDESLKLACELANSVSSSLLESNVKVSGVAVVPVVLSHEDEQFSILIEDRPAVLLEVGNINVNKFSQDSKKAIAAGILGGIKNA